MNTVSKQGTDVMHGKVLRDDYFQSCGIPQFIQHWQEDAVNAIEQMSRMFDKDSYPGQYIKQLVSDGVIDRYQLHTAMQRWILLQYSCLIHDDGHHDWSQLRGTLVEIYAYASYPFAQEMCNWFELHYALCTYLNEKGILEDEKDGNHRAAALLPQQLLNCVCRSQEIHDNALRKYLQELFVRNLQDDISQCHMKIGVNLQVLMVAAYYSASKGVWNEKLNELLIHRGQQIRHILQCPTAHAHIEQKHQSENIFQHQVPYAHVVKNDFLVLIGSFLTRSCDLGVIFESRNRERARAWLTNQCIHE